MLAKRVENIRLVDWTVWAYGDANVNVVLDERPDATVLDIGGFTFPGEGLVVALSVLDDLWAKRESRRPILIVIDEAHNLCSPDNDSPLHRALCERIIQIAAGVASSVSGCFCLPNVRPRFIRASSPSAITSP